MEDLKDKVRHYLKEKRLKKGYSQKKMSELLFGNGGSRTYISDVERGEITINTVTLGKWLEALDTEIIFVER